MWQLGTITQLRTLIISKNLNFFGPLTQSQFFTLKHTYNNVLFQQIDQKLVLLQQVDTSHSQMLGKFEYGGGPIFKVVLEC